jgi:hypothetical protein
MELDKKEEEENKNEARSRDIFIPLNLCPWEIH